jgi:hypothetical protein
VRIPPVASITRRSKPIARINGRRLRIEHISRTVER